MARQRRHVVVIRTLFKLIEQEERREIRFENINAHDLFEDRAIEGIFLVADHQTHNCPKDFPLN